MKMFSTKIDIPSEAREKMIELLNQQLADTFDLYSQTKQAHWNVKGPHFYQLHELFDKLAEELEGYIDSLAERVTTLGGMAMGTVRMSASASRLPEYPTDAVDGMDVVKALVERYAALCSTTRSAIEMADQAGDAVTSELLTEITRGLDKALWFLEAHLQR